MILLFMNRIKFAIILNVFFLAPTAFAQDYDLEKLTTKDGKVYQEVQIIDADKEGLLFRHKRGITKEPFPFLTANIRDMFEPVGKVPQTIEVDLGEKPTNPQIAAPPTTQPIPEVVLTFWIRRPLCTVGPSFCGMHRNPQNWPTQWHRFNDAHLLTNPIYRAAATRNLLITAGLLPTACGG